MKITNLRTVFSGSVLYVVIETDEGLTGLGESTLHSREFAVASVLDSLKAVLIGKDPTRLEHIWQDIFRGTFWRGGPVLMSALSGVDMALWDIKGKALNTPVYDLLGGKCREKLRVYINVGGKDDGELRENAQRLVEKGYKTLRFCPVEAQDNILDVFEASRRAIHTSEVLRNAVGPEIGLILELHTRMTPPTAVDIINAVEPLHLMFVEDPLRSDSPEAFRNLRRQTRVPLGTGEKFGALWDYRTLIEEDLIDYLRTDICSCGGISMMRKIANYGEAHYMEMVPHGVHHAAFLALMNVDFAVENFAVQEDWVTQTEQPPWLDYDIKFENGYITMADRPGLGVTLIEKELLPAKTFEHPHLRRPDGSVQDW